MCYYVTLKHIQRQVISTWCYTVYSGDAVQTNHRAFVIMSRLITFIINHFEMCLRWFYINFFFMKIPTNSDRAELGSFHYLICHLIHLRWQSSSCRANVQIKQCRSHKMARLLYHVKMLFQIFTLDGIQIHGRINSSNKLFPLSRIVGWFRDCWNVIIPIQHVHNAMPCHAIGGQKVEPNRCIFRWRP